MPTPQRYPELRNASDLERSWAGLIRALEIRDMSQNYTDINGLVVKVNQDYNIKDTDGVVLGDATNGMFSVYLPSAKRYTSRIMRFKATAGSFYLVAPDNQTVGGSSSVLVGTMNLVTVISDGDNWIIL